MNKIVSFLYVSVIFFAPPPPQSQNRSYGLVQESGSRLGGHAVVFIGLGIVFQHDIIVVQRSPNFLFIVLINPTHCKTLVSI